MGVGLRPLTLCLCLVAAAHQGPLVAQGSEEGCLNPLPSPPAKWTSLPLPQVPGGWSGGDPAYRVSDKGRLCGGLPLLPLEEALHQALEARQPKPGKASLLSAAAPGGGQWLLGQDRWTLYGAVEVWAWSQFLQRRQEGRNLQRRYRDLAWLVARRVSAGTRTEAGWDYYEALSKFQSSGAWDMDPQSPGIQPEANPETYNGSMWALAQALFLPADADEPVDQTSPSYQKALRYYMSRAYRPELAWNWGANQLHREEYVSLIRESDENLRRSTTMIGVILANHLLSAVDALVAGRLGLLGEEERLLEVFLLPSPFEDHRVAVQFRLPARAIRGR
jgi:hypothetical protein